MQLVPKFMRQEKTMLLPHNPGAVGSPAHKALEEEVSLVMMNQLAPAMEAALQRSYNLTDFQLFGGDDEGGHFNREFNITANAGRMKALYAREPWVWTAVQIIIKAMASIDFVVKSQATGEVVPDHPLNKLINGGSVHQDKMSLRMSTYIDMVTGGNGLIAMSPMYDGPMQAPVENVQLKYRECSTAEQERLVMEEGLIESVQLQRAFSYGATCGAATIIPYEQIVHFKFPNPFDPTWGISLLIAASRPILLDRHKNEFEMAFYLRGATNAGVIETTEDITKSRMERLMRTFEQAFTGKRNWWRTLFLPKGAKWINSGLTMNEMQHLEGLRENRRTLLACLGVPPSQVGIVEDVNRSTSETQETAYWHNTVIPLIKLVASGWNQSHLIRRVYGGQVYVEPDLAGIPAVEGSIQTKGERAKALDNVATINEQREIAGLPPLRDDDPRGKMFIVELQKAVMNPFANFETPQVEDIGVAEPDDDMIEVEVAQAEGGDHQHVAMIDPETGEGHTIETVGTEGGEVDPHDHQVVGEVMEDGTIVGHVQEGGADGHTHPDIVFEPEDDEEGEARAQITAQTKAAIISNQERIQRRRERQLVPVVSKNQESALKVAEAALRDGRDVRVALQESRDMRLSEYARTGMQILGDTLAEGFDMAMATTKAASVMRTKRAARFEPEDEMALQAIRQRTEDDRRKLLQDRNIRMFFAFDETLTEEIMLMIEKGLEEGLTTEKVAERIATQFGEAYRDQAFTIARTETLSAISEGIKWQQDALRQVFDKVMKQWFHVGDVGVNPDARSGHASFETASTDESGSGIVPADYRYINPVTGNTLLYPRDPQGGAKDVINCRCSMVNVVPEDATSNASAILEGN